MALSLNLGNLYNPRAPMLLLEEESLAKLYSTAKLIKDFKICVDDGRAHSVSLDLPPELGIDMGPTALELGVMSYAGYSQQFSL